MRLHTNVLRHRPQGHEPSLRRGIVSSDDLRPTLFQIQIWQVLRNTLVARHIRILVSITTNSQIGGHVQFLYPKIELVAIQHLWVGFIAVYSTFIFIDALFKCDSPSHYFQLGRHRWFASSNAYGKLSLLRFS